ncbi:fumarate hydratase [Anaerotignum sp. MSJ-24]|uniref:fumarate hydratase n=1 Tax=Anaerotignum sp. MSJ-24 TaxID=2841521 RepID=UPI001C1131C6|nr:fumarate hydratase [Anaerotignum sp. MSJ-24]MBU5463909.1 fumarate hydratase [Anaerotignum sp. MSJ-24]
MREINVSEITNAVAKLCIDANCKLNSDVYNALENAKKTEESEIGKEILCQLTENADIAKNENMPICQDTGMAVIFVELGQEVHISGGKLTDAINEGVRKGYTEGYLRKSVVKDPFIRENTKDNTPAIIHYDIVEGDKLKITVAPKGFGSENMSQIFMLKPSAGIEGAKDAIVRAVDEAGPNPCPPMVVGVGVGGNFEMSAYLAKKALLRPIGSHSDKPHLREMEEELLERMNNLGIGPQGLGGRTTVLGVNVESYPTHIAGMPIAVNISCHVTRHAEVIL